jgi:hypothetical protein
MNWHSYQINILVHITYWSNSNSNAYDEDSKILTEYHFYFSDDCKHDSKFVQHCFDFLQDGIMRGLMGVLINLSLQNLGILYLGIPT